MAAPATNTPGTRGGAYDAVGILGAQCSPACASSTSKIRRQQSCCRRWGSMPIACTTMSNGIVIGRLTRVSSPLTISLFAIRRDLGDARLDVFDFELLLGAPVIVGLIEPDRCGYPCSRYRRGSRAAPRGSPWPGSRKRCSRSWSTTHARSGGRGEPTHNRIATRVGLRPSEGQCTPLLRGNHLLHLRCRDDVLVRPKTPLRLVDGESKCVKPVVRVSRRRTRLFGAIRERRR